MPNEQTSVPLFASGEVLTASNLNLSAGTGVPVFTNTTTRDAAFGGAGEKVLAEGQLCYLSDSNIVQYYDGAAWATVGPATASGLVCVKAETAITAATTVNIDSVFTSSYTNYLINLVWQGSAGDDVFARFRVGGVDASGANYNSQEIQAVTTTVNGARNTGMTSWMFAQNSNGVKSSTTCMLFGPQLATATTMQQTESNSLGSYTSLRYKVQALNHTLTTAYDGLTLFSTTAFTGTYAIYGYSKTV